MPLDLGVTDPRNHGILQSSPPVIKTPIGLPLSVIEGKPDGRFVLLDRPAPRDAVGGTARDDRQASARARTGGVDTARRAGMTLASTAARAATRRTVIVIVQSTLITGVDIVAKTI